MFRNNPEEPIRKDANILYGTVPLDPRGYSVRDTRCLLQTGSPGYLGNILAYNYVIEFQKRGLPHVHILVYLLEAIVYGMSKAINLVEFRNKSRDGPWSHLLSTTNLVDYERPRQ